MPAETKHPPVWLAPQVIFGAKIVLAAVCLGFAARLVEPAQWGALADNKAAFLVAAVGWFANQVLCAVRLSVLMGSVGHQLPIRSALRLVFASFFIGSVLPGVIAQDVAKIVLIRGATAATNLLTLIVVAADRLIGLLTVWLVSFVLGFWVVLPPTPAARALLGLINLIGLGVVAGILAGLAGKLLLKAAHRRAGTGKIADYIGALNTWLSRRAALLTIAVAVPISIAAVVALVLAQALIGAMLMTAAGQPPALLEQGFLAPASIIVSALPLAPSGIGVGQLTLGGAYHVAGLTPSVAILLTTIMQISQVVVAVTIGLPVFLRQRRGSTLEIPGDEKRRS